MSAVPTQHAWSSEALFNKALLYAEEMERYTANDWQFGLWSSLSLELVARAALAYISPTLLANRRDWRNTYHALGHPAMAQLFTPDSITIKEVLSILGELLPDFTKELFNFCITHCARRNAELHSGEEVFAGLGTSAWLPKYYASCGVLLQSMSKGFEDLFDDPKTAEEMITSLHDKAAKAVAQDIEAHKQLWLEKDPDKREALMILAAARATRNAGHRTECPACSGPAIIRGSRHGVVAKEVIDDVIVQRQTMLPSSFQCLACGLKIIGLSKLSACGLGDAFTATSRLSAAEFFDLHTEDELTEARGGSVDEEASVDFDFNE